MPFDSYVFVLFFLPLLVLVWRAVAIVHKPALGLVLLGASILFCFWASPAALLILGLMILVNYGLGLALAAPGEREGSLRRKGLLFLALVLNFTPLLLVRYLPRLGSLFPSLSGVEREIPFWSTLWEGMAASGPENVFVLGTTELAGISFWTLVQAVSVKEFYGNLNRQIFTAAAVVFAMLGISLLFVWIATSHIAKPTRELLESMKTLGKENRYPRVKVVSQDEIGMIGTEYNKMAENIETLIEKVYKMELAQKQAELEFLQMQINPHFLYNALDTISWKALGEGNLEVSEMSIALAELLRATIKKESFIPLKEEMTTVRDYLYIQEQRFGDKISVAYQVEDNVEKYQVPNFILQPLIENAIIHGLEPKLEKGRLLIQIQKEEDRLYFLVADDGVGMSVEEIETLYAQCEENDTSKSIGIKNVYRRLILCYGEESKLYIKSKKNKGTEIRFSIPLKKGNRETDVEVL